MGKKKGGFKGKGKRANPSERYDDVPETNEAFETYYKAQEIITDIEGDASEWRQFMKSLKTELPTTFRITGSKRTAQDLNDVVRNTYVPFLSGLQHQGEPVEPPQQIPWYPDGLAWHLKINKQVIRKSSEFKRFQNFLVYESEAGNVSRQEAVSMIPPLLLDVLPHHYVLDMCAAPGSKTGQLLEALHATTDDPETTAAIPSGLLIANDSDYKRTHLLIHQSLRRIPSPAMMVTNLDAALFPNLKIPAGLQQADPKAPTPSNLEGASKKLVSLQFDRILCDVPCTGDGTLRKNVGIWRDWSAANGHGLHPVQVRILERGIKLLRPGGRLVYSTCSLNPTENEAVVSAALANHPKMSLVDVSDRLPELLRRPGMTRWKVMKRDLSEELADVSAVPASDARRYPQTLWPDGKEADRHLERCLRIYPHLQDTGGFFVAVLEKSADLEPAINGASAAAKRVEESDEILDAVMSVDSEVAAEAAAESLPPSSSGVGEKRPRSSATPPAVSKKPKSEGPTSQEEQATVDTAAEDEPLALDKPQAVPQDPKPAATKGGGKDTRFKEDPFTFLSPDDEQVKICINFFDLQDNFPANNLLVRNAEGQPVRSIYLTSTLVRNIVLCNAYTRMRLVSCGVKLFARQDNKSHGDDAYRCKWRVVSDGTTFFRPFVGPARVVPCTVQTLRQLMDGSELYPKFEKLVEPAFSEAIRKMPAGSCIVDVQPGEFEGAVVRHPMPVGLWISKTSVNIMIEKRDKSALSLRVFGIDVSATTKGKKAEATQEEEAATVLGGEAEAVLDGEGGEERAVEEGQGAETMEFA